MKQNSKSRQWEQYVAPKIEVIPLRYASLLTHPSYPVDTCATFEGMENQENEWISDEGY